MSSVMCPFPSSWWQLSLRCAVLMAKTCSCGRDHQCRLQPKLSPVRLPFSLEVFWLSNSLLSLRGGESDWDSESLIAYCPNHEREKERTTSARVQIKIQIIQIEITLSLSLFKYPFTTNCPSVCRFKFLSLALFSFPTVYCALIK